MNSGFSERDVASFTDLRLRKTFLTAIEAGMNVSDCIIDEVIRREIFVKPRRRHPERGFFITPCELKMIIRLSSEKKSAREISRYMNISRSTAYSYQKAFGFV